jgi:hypothetical protein
VRKSVRGDQKPHRSAFGGFFRPGIYETHTQWGYPSRRGGRHAKPDRNRKGEGGERLRAVPTVLTVQLRTVGRALRVLAARRVRADGRQGPGRRRQRADGQELRLVLLC